jgi:hypothetical protein
MLGGPANVRLGGDVRTSVNVASLPVGAGQTQTTWYFDPKEPVTSGNFGYSNLRRTDAA